MFNLLEQATMRPTRNIEKRLCTIVGTARGCMLLKWVFWFASTRVYKFLGIHLNNYVKIDFYKKENLQSCDDDWNVILNYEQLLYTVYNCTEAISPLALNRWIANRNFVSRYFFEFWIILPACRTVPGSYPLACLFREVLSKKFENRSRLRKPLFLFKK